MVWRPFTRQVLEIVETLSIIETRIRQRMAGTAERICAKFTLCDGAQMAIFASFLRPAFPASRVQQV